MRSSFAESTAGLESEELLTTGEAAQLLGVSRQHIVDLCRAGDLPYTLVGTHRRVRRRDVELLRSRQHRLTRDQLRSLLLSHAVAGRIVMDPVGTLALARQNLERMRTSSARGSARVWLQEWQSLLDGPLPELLSALTSLTPRSRELRQNTPFAGVLSEDERQRVLAGLRPSAAAG